MNTSGVAGVAGVACIADTVDCIELVLLSELQSLILLNLDSLAELSESAERVDHPEIASLFRSIATERNAQAAELQSIVRYAGKEAVTCGTPAGTFHNIWIDLRSAVSGNDSHAILAAAERGEDYINAAYENVLDRTYGFPLYATISQHSATVKASHDRIRVLRDSFGK